MKVSEIVENEYIKDNSAAICELFADLFTCSEQQDKCILEVSLSKEDLNLIDQYCPEIIVISFESEIGEPVGYLWGAEVYLNEGHVWCFPNPIYTDKCPESALAISCKRVFNENNESVYLNKLG